MFEKASRFRFSFPVLLLLLFILVCGAAFRLAPLPHEALEGDEVFSRSVALLSPLNEIIAIRNDLVHPPLYYFVLQATTKLWGADPNGLRAFSLLCGGASAILLVFLGCILPNSRFAGILAAAVLAVNRTHIFYSQEARSYSWYALLVLLLVFWVWRVTRLGDNPPTFRHWALGALLMTAIVYTHYIGAIYVGSAVLAILVSHRPLSRRVPALVCACVAGLCFLPWFLAVVGVYKAKHGIGSNLDWQGHPTLYSLVQAFASAFGIPEIRGGTSLVILVIGFLIVTALLLERQPSRRSPVVLSLLFLSILPPIVVFLLSRPPANLPLFGIRHFLPSILSIILLCCYGIDRLAQRMRSQSTLVFATGSIILLGITIVPTLHNFVSRPIRAPYDLVAQEVERDRTAGLSTYTTKASFYGIGEPVNFYCATARVAQLPSNDRELPSEIALLYRPGFPLDLERYRQLQRDGFSEIEKHEYTQGGYSGTTVTILKRIRKM